MLVRKDSIIENISTYILLQRLTGDLMSHVAPQAEPILVSVNGAAAMLGISRPTIYKMLNSGALRAVKSGARTLIPMQALRDYAASLLPYALAADLGGY